MTEIVSRRDVVKSGAAFLSAAALGKWQLPALQPSDEVVPWTDVPPNFNPGAALDTRMLRREAFITPSENFYLVQHYGLLQVDSLLPAFFEPEFQGVRYT